MTKPTVSIIGLGRVGHAMASALQSAGYRLDVLIFKHSTQEDTCRSLFSMAKLLHSSQLELVPPSDLLLITTPDDAVAKTAEELASFQKAAGQRVALHTSGALSSAVLLPLREVGFSTGSMHPLVSVGYPPDGAAALKSASYCVEGDELAVSVAKDLVRDLGGESFQINTDSKALYHAAAVIASPHLVAMVDLVLELMSRTGLAPDAARKVLLELVESTVNNLQARDEIGAYRSVAWALTGTFARGDVHTVKLHLDALREDNDALELYKLLGLRSLQLAEKGGLDRERIDRIEKLLERS